MTTGQRASAAAEAKAESAKLARRDALLTNVLRELSHSQQRTRELFRKWDEDGSGSVGSKEFFRGLKALGITDELKALKSCKKEDIEALFELLDVDHNGKLIPSELGVAVSGILKGVSGGKSGDIDGGDSGDKSHDSGAPLPLGEVMTKRKQSSQTSLGAPAAAAAAGCKAVALAGPKAEKAAQKIEANFRGIKGRKRARVVKVVADPSVDPSVAGALLSLKQEVANALQKILTIFQSWDYDGSGTVTKKEFRQGLALLNVSAPREVIDGLFDLLDTNHSNTIEYEELRSQLQAPTLPPPPTKAELRAQAERKRKAMAKAKANEAKRLRAEAARLQGEARRAAEAAAAAAEAEAEVAARDAAAAVAAAKAEAEAMELLREQLLAEVVQELAREEALLAHEWWARETSPLGRSWRACWSAMVLKDLPGYPLWTSELHDILKDSFEELQSIFIHYCSDSVQGTTSIGNATKLGLQEMLALCHDCRLPCVGFEVADLQRQFHLANSLGALRASSSAERHKLNNDASRPVRSMSARGSSPARTLRTASPRRRANTPSSAISGAASGVDQQLNLYEFINFLVRTGFGRYNPVLSKDGAAAAANCGAEITPVPQSVELLLQECILPLAKRDASVDFRARLRADLPTLDVLGEYRERLRRWMTRISRQCHGRDVNPVTLPYDEWINLMDGPDGNATPWSASDEAKRKARCPKMVGEWFLQQESQITGDERTSVENRLTFKAKLSIPQCRWNFLRSQPITQVTGNDAGASSMTTLEFEELLECVVRCAVDTYAHPMNLYLPSHGRNMMTMASATRAWLATLFWEKSPERSMWEASLITADRFDWESHRLAVGSSVPEGLTSGQYRLWCSCWPNIPLMDLHHFPLWEKGVHDTLLARFASITRIFSYYTKGISGVGSAAGAAEMELEEFHDFVKDAKLETRLVSFTLLTNAFKQADATRTAQTYEIRVRERRHPQVTLELEMQRRREESAAVLALKGARRAENERASGLMAGSYGQLAAAEVKQVATPGFDTQGRRSFASMESLKKNPLGEYGEALAMKTKTGAGSEMLAKGDLRSAAEPSARLNLTEFLGLLVRVSYLRANPMLGDKHNPYCLMELPGCLRRMLEEQVLVHAKQDTSSAFRDELARNAEVQSVFKEYRARLQAYHHAMSVVRLNARSRGDRFTMDIFLAICNGTLTYAKRKVVQSDMLSSGNSGANVKALVGDATVRRGSDITGDVRCKEWHTCRLSTLEAKMAFLHSQSLEKMTAGNATIGDAQACLEFDEFLECIARCAAAKYGEIKLISQAQGVRGIIQNLLGEKTDEAVIRDAIYIHADRYDCKLSTPLGTQSASEHYKWLACWQNIEIADLHHFPLWERGVFECLREVFAELCKIFAFYCKSVGGDSTAEDAMEMTMTEFKKLVKDVRLETAELPWSTIQSLFIKANALKSNAAHFQRKDELGNSHAKAGGSAIHIASKVAALGPKLKHAAKQGVEHKDAELVLYEFVELIVRIAFQRANPNFGKVLPPRATPSPDKGGAAIAASDLPGTLVPLPDCLHTMLHKVLLPRAKRDQTQVFRERLVQDQSMQAVLALYEDRLCKWFNVHTQLLANSGRPRALQYQQWQDLLKHGGGGYKYSPMEAPGFTPGHLVGDWQIHRDSEITGDERCKEVFKVTFSTAKAKACFSESQLVDQLTVGQISATDAVTTLDFAEFKECLARCGVAKYAPLAEYMPEPVRVRSFIRNLLGEANTEQCVNEATIIRAERYHWKRLSKPLQGQLLKEHRKWLEVWQRLELMDIHHFPLWETDVHDLLQTHFNELCLIFLAYCRSLLGSDTAEDAMQMEMAEFKDFVDECHLETKMVKFDVMCNV